MGDIGLKRMMMMNRHMQEHREALREVSARHRVERQQLYAECVASGGHGEPQILPGAEHPNYDGSWPMQCPICGAPAERIPASEVGDNG